MNDEPQAESSKPIALGGPTSHDPAPPDAVTPEYVPHEPVAPEPVPPDPVPPDPVAPEPVAPEPAAAPASTAVPEQPRRSVLMPLLGLLGFVILAGAIAYLWVRPVPMSPAAAMPPDESGPVAALQTDVATLKTQLAALDAREASDVAALHQAIAALPTPAPAATPTPSPAPIPAPTPAPAVASAAPDDALKQQLAALSDRLSQVQAAEAAQAQRSQGLPSAADIATLAARVDALAQRETKDGDAVRQDLGLVQQQLASVTSQTQSLAKTATALPQISAKADRLGELLRAEDALTAGLPLGTITDAPPALARFATTAPPTEAQLRLSYVQAAQAADKASQPQPADGRFWHRVLVHVEDLVTLRQGDHVILGDQTSGVLAHAQRLLDAGDVAGALSVLDALSGPAAAAMAPWEAQAKAVVAARQALAQMAAG
jgi:hypothetical protein